MANMTKLFLFGLIIICSAFAFDPIDPLRMAIIDNLRNEQDENSQNDLTNKQPEKDSPYGLLLDEHSQGDQEETLRSRRQDAYSTNKQEEPEKDSPYGLLLYEHSQGYFDSNKKGENSPHDILDTMLDDSPYEHLMSKRNCDPCGLLKKVPNGVAFQNEVDELAGDNIF
jgi:hypothetical protein